MLKDTFGSAKPIIAMVHFPPLPGTPLYDAKGGSWVYTTSEPLVFTRHPIKIDFTEGDLAVLAEGPATGTSVVTMGATELWGSEFYTGH